MMKYGFYLPIALIFLFSCSVEKDCQLTFMSEKYSPNGNYYLSSFFRVCGNGTLTSVDQVILLAKDEEKIGKKYSENNKIAIFDGGQIESFNFDWEDNNTVVISTLPHHLPIWKKSSTQEVLIRYK